MPSHSTLLNQKNVPLLGTALLICSFVLFFFISRISVPWGDAIDVIERYTHHGSLNFIILSMNEHFTFITNLINLVDLNIGYLDFRLAASAALFLYLIQFYLVCRYLVFVDRNSWNWWIVAAIAITSFASYRLIVINNPINNAHFLVGFFAFLAVLTYAGQRQSLGRQKIFLWFGALIFSTLALLTLANGFLVFPIILLIHLRCSEIFLTRSLATRLTCICILVVGGVFAFYVLVFFKYKTTSDFSNPTDIAGALWFYIRATGLPFTGISTSYYPGILFSVFSIVLALYYLLRFFCIAEVSFIQNVAVGLILFSIGSLLLVSFARHEHYQDFFSHGHRYAIFNLSLHSGIIIFIGMQVKECRFLAKKITLLIKVGILFTLITAAIGSFIVGNYLVERKNEFVEVANSLARGQHVDRELFYRLGFYPSLWWAKKRYADFVKDGFIKHGEIKSKGGALRY